MRLAVGTLTHLRSGLTISQRSRSWACLALWSVSAVDGQNNTQSAELQQENKLQTETLFQRLHSFTCYLSVDKQTDKSVSIQHLQLTWCTCSTLTKTTFNLKKIKPKAWCSHHHVSLWVSRSGCSLNVRKQLLTCCFFNRLVQFLYFWPTFSPNIDTNVRLWMLISPDWYISIRGSF